MSSHKKRNFQSLLQHSSNLENPYLSPNKSLNVFNVCQMLIIWHTLSFSFRLPVTYDCAVIQKSNTHAHTHIVNSLYWDVSACINIDKPYWGSKAGSNNKRGKVAGRSSQTVCTKSNYQSHGINIPAVWQVTAPSFQPPYTASMG